MRHRETHMTYDESPNPVATSIHATIAQHGALRVLSAAFLALVHPPQLRPPPTNAGDLDDHLRRDVGLPPKRAAGPPLPINPFLP